LDSAALQSHRLDTVNCEGGEQLIAQLLQVMLGHLQERRCPNRSVHFFVASNVRELVNYK